MAELGQHDQSCPPARCWWKRGAASNGIGRSRGGPTTKVHLVVDALGLPLAFEITEGQRHDLIPAPGLVEKTGPRALLADRAYDSDAFRTLLAQRGCEAVIPPRSTRVAPTPYDKHLFKSRSAVECTFNLLKQARRFATRRNTRSGAASAYPSKCIETAIPF